MYHAPGCKSWGSDVDPYGMGEKSRARWGSMQWEKRTIRMLPMCRPHRGEGLTPVASGKESLPATQRVLGEGKAAREAKAAGKDTRWE